MYQRWVEKRITEPLTLTGVPTKYWRTINKRNGNLCINQISKSQSWAGNAILKQSHNINN